MNTLEYVKNRRKQKCNPPKHKIDTDLHSNLGRILIVDVSEHQKMEVEKPRPELLPPGELDFIF